MSDQGNQSPAGGAPQDAAATEHLNIKVTDNSNEVFFKIKRTTQLKKLMDAFCDRQGKMPSTCRFLFDGDRVNPTDTPDSVSETGHTTQSLRSRRVLDVVAITD
jgi:hypothetical protein